jgi:tRNA-uridine 2-sulfurtransferase
MSSCTAIALSGGIDSLVAAALLKEQGRHLIGLHFVHGLETGQAGCREAGPDPVYSAIENHARRTMQPLADQLGIPLYIIDLRVEFKRRVVDYFVETYSQGKTPNPCLVCNPSIKFELLLEKARAWGADSIATGHYARIVPAEDGRMRLLRGTDRRKDQSYFLSRLSQAQMATAVLPLGNQTKDQTRRIARRKGLIPANAAESQDVCFIKDGTYSDFLGRQPGFTSAPGPIVDLQGNVVGRHKGLHRFTIGQRRGINCPAQEPYYVVRIDHERNRLFVGGKKDLASPICRVDHINWIAPAPEHKISVMTRVRYRHKAVPSVLIPAGDRQAEIHFEVPEPAVTPGQGAVFYLGDEVIGGGWIQ